MIYRWKDGAHVGGGLKKEPQAVGSRLEALRRKGGKLTAQIVVKDARPKDSLLHPAFEWDNTKAAEEYRLEQARSLIRSIVIVRDDTAASSPIRAFVMVAEDADTPAAYSSISIVMNDPKLRAQVLARAKKELIEWRSRYKELEEFAALFGVIDKSVENVA